MTGLLKDTVREILLEYGSTAILYEHQGYSGDADDFWYEDENWPDEGTEITLLSDSIFSSISVEQHGFMETGDVVFWLDTECTEGDLIENNGEWLVDRVVTMQLSDNIVFYGVEANEIER